MPPARQSCPTVISPLSHILARRRTMQYGAESWPAILFLSLVAVVFLVPAVLLSREVRVSNLMLVLDPPSKPEMRTPIKREPSCSEDWYHLAFAARSSRKRMRTKV